MSALVVIEGAASLFFAGREVRRGYAPPAAERAYTRYDRDLGWASIPVLRRPDFFGRGRSLTTNARGFRGARETADAVPAGRARVVCSGDSYTLGFGVGDDETWCHQLEAIDPRRETINMGQGGYGLDQAWLWYRRDGQALAHGAQVFAFIFDDFRRMLSDDFEGYGKPVVRLDGGRLEVANVPVPRRGYYAPWVTQNARLLRALRSVSLLDEAWSRTRPHRRREKDVLRDALPLALRVFEDLAERNRAKGSVLHLVFLPDCGEDVSADGVALRAALARETSARGLRYLDLVTATCGQREDVVNGYFISEPGPVPGVPGHYSPAGNRFVAEAIDAELRLARADADGERR